MNDRDAPGSPSEMIGRAHYCMRDSPFGMICRILKAPRVDLAFTHAVIPRMPGGCSYYQTSFSLGPCVTLHFQNLCTWDPFETVIDFWLLRSHPVTSPLTITMTV